MTTIPAEHILTGDERAMPLLWVTKHRIEHPLPDASDAALSILNLPAGKGRLVRSWGHHPETGVHWLLTRGGTPVHTDKAYLRYTHQIVLRNDGTRIRGLPRLDPNPDQWPPPLLPGAFYCLDTHSPHQGTIDPRLPQEPGRIKVVIAVDRDEPLSPKEAFDLMAPYLHRHPADDGMTTRPPKWKPPAGPKPNRPGQP